MKVDILQIRKMYYSYLYEQKNSILNKGMGDWGGGGGAWTVLVESRVMFPHKMYLLVCLLRLYVYFCKIINTSKVGWWHNCNKVTAQ